MSINPIQLNAEESKLLTKVTTMGSATSLPVVMSPSELAKLIGVIYYDTSTSAKHGITWKKVGEAEKTP